jgi:predicted RNA-binding protein YlxR (DUF448 family)
LKKLPQRTCIGCNSKKDKKELIRIVKNKNEEINVDLTGKMDGRGIYICKNEECLDKAIKNKRISRTFEMEIANSIYENIRKIINGGEIIG